MIAKLFLAISVLTLLGGSVYFFLMNKPEAAVFEQEENLLEEDFSESTILPSEEATPRFTEVLSEDCMKECSTFQSLPDQYVYCRSVCGLPLTALENSSPVQPADSNLEKDLQQKNTAIKESDLSKCEAIKDTQLKKSCQVRVTEDLLE